MQKCKKCHKELDEKDFSPDKKQYWKRIEVCKDCIAKKFHNLTVERKYKEIHPSRILDTKIDTLPDEIFVRLIDSVSRAYISNYGRCIVIDKYGNQKLLTGSGEGLKKTYRLFMNVVRNEKLTVVESKVNAAKAVIRMFVYNMDFANNTKVWNNGNDLYYKNLFPVNAKQYKKLEAEKNIHGILTESQVMAVINDEKFKSAGYRARDFVPTVCGVGYWGCSDVDTYSRIYKNWICMINRCYNKNLWDLPDHKCYKDCIVDDELLNFSNYQYFYERHYYHLGNTKIEGDHDILFSGIPQKEYSIASMSFVPSACNRLVVAGRTNGLPEGVKRNGDKYESYSEYMRNRKYLGIYNSPEEAFAAYKEYREKFIHDVAKTYEGKIPQHTYEKLMNWELRYVV